MFKSVSIILLGFTMLHDCAPVTNSNPVPPRPTPIPIDTDQCQSAEDHLTQLCKTDSSTNSYCCLVVAPTKKGKTFTQFCQDKQTAGVSLNPKCLSQVNSCSEIDACTGSK